MALALADPQQGGWRIPANARLDNLGRRVKQPRLPVNRRLAAAAGPPHSPPKIIRAAAKLGQPATDRAARHRGCLGYRLDPPPPRRPRFARRNQPPPALVKKRRDGGKARLDGGDVDHPSTYQHRRSQYIHILILLLRS